jgi:phosphoglycerate dehydrogenase-like enzyme
MRIAVLDDYQGVALEMADWSPVLARAQVDVFTDHVVDEEVLVQRLAPYDAVVLMRERTPLPGRVVRALPRLRLVVSTGRKNASVDLDACREQGVTVCGTESPASAPGELTWALILAISRNLVPEATAMASGGWQSTIGRDLAGRTLGVVGLGRIGAQVATVGQAFGMRVLAWSQHLTAGRAAEVGAVAVPFDRLLSESDVVTVHLVLSERTRGLLGREQLAMMKSDATLVNTSRAGIVDTDALLHALDNGHLGGVGLDVFDEEPLPADHPLRTAPRTVLTPHLGYVTQRVYRTFYSGVVEDVVAYLDGAPVRLL